MHGPVVTPPHLDPVSANAHTGDMANVTYRAPRGHTELIKRAAKAAGVKGYTTFIREAAERVAREVLDEADSGEGAARARRPARRTGAVRRRARRGRGGAARRRGDAREPEADVTRLVVDASVVVTAICSRWRRRGGGTRPPSSAIVLRMVHLGLAESLVSDEIEAEWRRVVEYDYPRKMAPARQRRAVVEALVRASRRVSPATMAGAVPGDPSDEILRRGGGRRWRDPPAHLGRGPPHPARREVGLPDPDACGLRHRPARRALGILTALGIDGVEAAQGGEADAAVEGRTGPGGRSD